MKVAFGVDIELAASQPASEHVTTGAPVGGNEVEVVAGDVQTLRVVGKPEADETTGDIVKLEGGLVFDDLYEGWVGLALARHAARLDELEVPIHPDSGAHGAPTDNPVQVVAKCLEVHRHGKGLGRIRLEDRHHGERGPGPSFDSVGSSVGLYLVEAAVQADHLAVESVERAQPEISTTSSSAKLTSPSYLPSNRASTVEVWNRVWWRCSSPPRSRSLRYSTCSAPTNAVSIGIRLTPPRKERSLDLIVVAS